MNEKEHKLPLEERTSLEAGNDSWYQDSIMPILDDDGTKLGEVAEKVSALNTESYLGKRASIASKDKFLKALNKVPDIEPLELDKI